MAWKSHAVHLGRDMSLSFANWSPSIWLLAAPVTIVTTDYLVHERHEHFPYHILIPHLLVAIAIRLSRRATDHGWKDFWTIARNGCRQLKTPTWSHVWSLASIVFGVISLFAAYQVFKHLPSILCTTLVLGLSPACATSVCAFFLQPDRLTAARVGLLAFCLLGIFLNDYRLTPPGFFLSFLALGTYIGAHFCRVQSRRADSTEQQDEPEEDDGVLWLLLAAVLPAFAAAWISETPGAMGFDLSMAPVMFSTNAVIGGIALANSGSLFARPQDVAEDVHANVQSIDAPALAGLVFVAHALLGRAVVISGWQVVAFLAAFLIALTASTYVDDADNANDYLRMPYMPTWRRVLGFEHRDGKAVFGLIDSEPGADDSRPAKCSCRISAWQILRLALLAIAAVGWACIFFKALQRSVASADLEINPYHPAPETTPRTFDIVVSYHDESLPELISTLTSFLVLPNIATLNQRITLYAKDPTSPTASLQQNLTAALPPNTSVTVASLPNLGREGETYLHHILDNYDSPSGLADHTLFLQAEMHDPYYMRPRITQYFVPQTGFLSLWHMETTCADCTSCRDHSSWNPSASTLATVFSAANNGSECADFVPTYRGQFIASAPRIRANGKSFYEDLRRRFTDAEEENPAWGYDLERLWGVVMQCPGGRRVGDRCPSMMAGMLGTMGDVADCQCLDA